MTEEERYMIVSEDYADLIIDYRSNPQILEGIPNSVVQIMNEAFAIAYIPVSLLGGKSLDPFSYTATPDIHGLTSYEALEASGVTQLRKIPDFNLRGSGILVGIVDTGINYTLPAFKKADGTTKIFTLWDQTIQSDHYPADILFGTEYLKDQINQALKSGNPLDVVPSQDENGHGTMLAAIAAGTDTEQSNFYGVAPDAELVVVKLMQPKNYLRDFYAIPESATCFQENSIMWGIQYCQRIARENNRPIVICISHGGSLDAHDGNSPLATYTSILAGFPRVGIVISAGNEGALGRHFYGVIDPSVGSTSVELNIGEKDADFSLVIWGNSPGIFSIDILSPSGEYIPRIPASLRVYRDIAFIFEKTTIHIEYLTVETETGDQLIFMRFNNATAGAWKFNVYGQGNLVSGFHIWLPMGDMISDETKFTLPDIYTTLLDPGTAVTPITVTAYNAITGTLYANASRGFTRANVIKPDFAAPGVNYTAPDLKGSYTRFTGTGVAAAHTAGIVALLLEWGVILKNDPKISSLQIKNYLIRGAKRSSGLVYPNRDWGYGILDIYNTFNVLQIKV